MKKIINNVAAAATGISTLFASAAEAQNRDHLVDAPRLSGKANKTPEISSIVNGQDRRVMVPLGGPNAAAFDAVGILRNGKESCTGTISEFQGYSSSYTLILTAAHCLNEQSAIGMTFTAATVDTDGQPTTYRTNIISQEVLQNSTHDIAILFAETASPNSITPGLVIEDYNFLVGQNIHTAGFATDRATDGMVAHINGSVEGNYSSYTTSNLDIANGQSGSPVITGINNGQLIVGGVINAVLQNSKLTTHDTIPAYFLDGSYFLVPNNSNKNAPVPRK